MTDPRETAVSEVGTLNRDHAAPEQDMFPYRDLCHHYFHQNSQERMIEAFNGSTVHG
jgi:hypothetical protein